MIIGIGVDMVEVAHLEARLDRGTILKAFSEDEQAYAHSHPLHRAQILAARWAAKEAFGKAMGAGLPYEWPHDQIEVVKDDAGNPSFKLGPYFDGKLPPGAVCHLSITHTPSHAAAFVVLEAPESA